MKTEMISKGQDSIITGLNKAANIITSTMSANGKTVIINSDNDLKITKDGVSVAKEINLPDPIENIGAKLLISAAKETVDSVGDGTTLTSLLLQKFVEYCKEDHKKYNILEKEVKKCIDHIKQHTRKVNTLEQIKNIATTASNSEEIGELFREIYEQTDFDIMIELEETEEPYTRYEVEAGLKFDSGFIHRSFMTDRKAERTVYEDAYIHISSHPIRGIPQEYQNYLSTALKEQIPLVIIAPDFSDAFFRQASMLRVNEGAPVCLVRTPGYGMGQDKNMDDLQAFLSEDSSCEKVVIDDYSCIFYNSYHSHLEERREELKHKWENAIEPYDIEDYRNRYYRLGNNIAVIYVGSPTKEAMKEQYDRIEDAIGSVQSSIKYGFVPGAGSILYQFDSELSVFKEPTYKILQNSNVELDDINEFLLSTPNFGYSIHTNSIEDLVEAGVLDSARVLIEALLNALSNTKLIINTNYSLYNVH